MKTTHKPNAHTKKKGEGLLAESGLLVVGTGASCSSTPSLLEEKETAAAQKQTEREA
jgi:hypothetical protein